MGSNTINDNKRQQNTTKVGHDGLFYDQHVSTLIRDDEEIKLETITAKLLVYFLDNPDRIISRAELADHVWEIGYISDNAINRSVSVLRKLLGGDINRYITTVPKKGYRFIHPAAEEVIEQDTTADTTADTSSGSEPDTKETAKTRTANSLYARWLVGSGLTGLLLLCIFVAIRYQQNHSGPDTIVSTGAMNIAVLPFVNKGNEPHGQLFVDGLTEQVVNRLTQIHGLVVLTSKQQSRAQYLLQGSVNQSGNTLHVTMQLIAADSGAYLFSTNFERTLKDTFAVQQDIAAQVASALKLSLIHKHQHYSTALANMDHQGVEQLVIARARLDNSNPLVIKQSFDDLIGLNQRYPQTPEVLGLLALVNHLSRNTKTGQSQDTLTLAKAALALDSTNLDALQALYYYYTNFAPLREQAYFISQQIILYHPGRAKAWRSRLHLMVNAQRPCDEIQHFVDTIPQGVFTRYRLSIVNQILGVCLQSQSLEGLVSVEKNGYIPAKTDIQQAKMTKAIDNNLYLFKLRHDRIFDAVISRSRRKPSQANLSDNYRLQLATGALSEASLTKKRIPREGFLSLLIAIYDTLYELPTTIKASDAMAYTKEVAYHKLTRELGAALIIQSKQSGDNTKVTEYLSSMPEFSINLFNSNEAIAIIMMQRHTGQQQLSQQTAKSLFDKLMVYHKNHRQSFKFWGLGSDMLIAKFHCGTQCELPKGESPQAVLAQLFKADDALWMDDIGFMRVALAPWSNDPVVVEYLAQIEQDRVRFRTAFGL